MIPPSNLLLRKTRITHSHLLLKSKRSRRAKKTSLKILLRSKSRSLTDSSSKTTDGLQMSVLIHGSKMAGNPTESIFRTISPSCLRENTGNGFSPARIRRRAGLMSILTSKLILTRWCWSMRMTPVKRSRSSGERKAKDSPDQVTRSTWIIPTSQWGSSGQYLLICITLEVNGLVNNTI